MNAEEFNDIARFLDEGFSEETQEDWRRILAEEPSWSLLAGAMRDAGKYSPPGKEPPLRVVALARIGCNEGFLRPFEMENFHLVGRFQQVAELLQNLTSRRLPLCFPKTLSLNLKGLPELEEVQLEVGQKDFSLDLRPRPNLPPNTYIEIWQQGQVARSFSIHSERKRSGSSLRMDKTTFLHLADSPLCAGIRLAPVEFTTMDWVSASLVCAVTGDFGRSLRVIEEHLRGTARDLDLPVRKIGGYLKGLIGCAHCEDFMLFPVPATRSATAGNERVKLALSVPWAGVQSVWPEIKNLKSPWNPQGEMDAATLGLPEPARALVSECFQALETGKVGEAPGPVSTDRVLSRAWCSFRGWYALAERRYDEALGYFTSVEIEKEDDPFGIGLGSMLSSHLAEAGRGEADENETSSGRIWRFITEELIASVKED